MASRAMFLPAPVLKVGPNVVLQPPLSRCRRGPGLLIVRPSLYVDCPKNNKSLDPEPLQKWAEESFAVAQATFDEALTSLPDCDKKDRFGLLVYGSPADYASGFEELLGAVVATTGKFAAGVYTGAWNPPDIPTLRHIPGPQSEVQKGAPSTVYSYPEASSTGFIVPGHSDFKISSAGVAHTRSLTFIKKHMGGPFFDLEKIWEEHTYYEFGDRSVEKTMATMVQEPYVNDVPTLTGGIGRASLSKFYRENFIFNNPDDSELELVSRTVGVDRVVDEFIFCLTHNKVIDWMLPGIPPTGKPLRIPFTAVVNIRGDRLYHEHIAWDQATALMQLGLLPEYLPFPYPLPDGRKPAPGKRFEYRVPAAGVETAIKLQHEHLVPSNEMFNLQLREINDSTR
ncbi:hypothetical protein ARAM_002023 [Aspergillus rambellii]|uniref:Carboxymethylenebutenolidase n=1 Tax=Aspergillus rambellii TaxID=308745 RepID=A0A0F8U639_9EURO|nr:hypothetical protein ARAM_002023 [Aspergillus rambellii]